MSFDLLRRGLFILPPEIAHRAALEALRLAERTGLILDCGLLGAPHSIECLGLTFPNRVGLAAGYDKNGEYVDALGALGFGFIEIGTVTPKAQPGNPKPRLIRIPEAEALINQMGSPNKGVDYVVRKIKRRKYRGILGVNIGKNADTPLEHAADDYLVGYRAVSPHVDYVAINVSSPNTKGLRELQAKHHLRRILVELSEERDRVERRVPILVKLSPDLSTDDLNALADTIAETGADGVIAANTTTSRDGVSLSQSRMESGGLSGGPLHRRTLDIICSLRGRLGARFTIIGVGGIMSADQALETLDAGANLVQIYAGLIYHGPRLIREVVEAIPAVIME